MATIGIDALKDCVRILRTQEMVARAVARRQQSVSEILATGQRVPSEWVIPLETATRLAGEEVSRHRLRPDIYGGEGADTRPGEAAA